jgi:hypothetical protein
MQTIEAVQAECPVIAAGANCRFLRAGLQDRAVKNAPLAANDVVVFPHEFKRSYLSRSPLLLSVGGTQMSCWASLFKRSLDSAVGSIVADWRSVSAAICPSREYLEIQKCGGFDP